MIKLVLAYFAGFVSGVLALSAIVVAGQSDRAIATMFEEALDEIDFEDLA